MTTQTQSKSVIENAQQIKDDTKVNFYTWDFGKHIDWSQIKPKYKNLKEEVLKNTFTKISKTKWNDILSKSNSILNFHVGSTDRIKFSQILKRNNIKLKNILALKLYCDEDNLQSEFRKCFISKYENDQDYNDRISSFYHWRKELNSAFIKLSKIKFFNKNNDFKILYHGVTCKSIINKQNGIFYGPLSTTTDISVAREFAGKNGMVLAIKPNINSIHKLLNLSLISDFPQEKEILLCDHNIHIKGYVYSNDFDNNYSYYKQYFENDTNNEITKTQIIKYINNNNKPIDITNINVVYIGTNNNNNNKNNNLNLKINNDTSVYLLCAIYKYAEEFIYNFNKYKQIEKEIIFNSIEIPKELYYEFLNYQCINETQCTHVLTEYIRV
eukprot:497498_1